MTDALEKSAKEELFFDSLAARQENSWWGHHTYTGKQRQIRRAQLIAQLLGPIPQTYKILEIGCGAGDFSTYLLDELPACRYTGIDISGGLLEGARKRISPERATFLKGNVEELNPDFGTFDAVLGASILHHLDVRKTLANICGILQPGGKVLFMEPNMKNPQVWLERNVRWIGKWLQNTEDETAFHKKEIADRLAQAGFKDIRVKPFDFMHPLIPQSFFPVMSKFCLWLEKTPVREWAGSLLIQGTKASRAV